MGIAKMGVDFNPACFWEPFFSLLPQIVAKVEGCVWKGGV